MTRKLTKTTARRIGAAETRLNGLILSGCGDWLTQGHFAVRLDTIQDHQEIRTQELLRARLGDLAADPATTGPDVLRCIPKLAKDDRERFTRTDWIADYVHRGIRWDLTLYVGDRGHLAFVQRRFSDWMDRPVMYGPLGESVEDAAGAYIGPLVAYDGDGEPDTVCMCWSAGRLTVRVARAIAAELQAIEQEREERKVSP